MEWEQHQPVKYELANGVPIAMPGGSEAHSIIQGSIFAAVLGKRRGRPCRALTWTCHCRLEKLNAATQT